ncbi:ATP-binding protein [Variovorax sp. J22P168]|uniref:hybrid sensor histidine kinase/response regulator n=1 Tax=Variovorax jilinensis TaxID=3053513 RepID=UPI0025762723|nr:ATP-binding protein [Variovorax sp. J22P168]MDM0015247.1 ATP-binding protein [Variovorax sp. J22P168]
MNNAPFSAPADRADEAATVSLRAYITGLIWLCMGPLILLAAYLAIDRVRDLRAERDAEATKLSQTIMGLVDSELNARIIALQFLGTSPLVDDPTRWGELYADAQRFRQIFDCHVIFGDRRMAMLWNTRVPFGTALPPLPRPKGRKSAPLALETGRPAVGDMFQGPVINQPLVAITVPVLRPAGTNFLLITTFESARFRRELDKVALPPGWTVALRDGQGDLIARSSGHREAMANGDSDSEQFVAHSALSQWSVAIEIPTGDDRDSLLGAAAVLLVAIAGATLAGFLGGKRASRRIGPLITSIGQTLHLEASSRDMAEFAQVRRLLDEAAKQRGATEATLRTSEARFRRLFDEAPMPMALVGEDGTVASLNARFIEVLGYTKADVPTMEAWWPLAYPDGERQAALQGEWHAATIAGNLGTAVPFERRVMCKDGTPRDLVISRIRIDEEMLFSFFDVTERNRAQARLHAQLERLSLLDQITSAVGQRQEMQSIYQVVLASVEARLPMDFCCVCEHDPAASLLRVACIGPDSEGLAAELGLSGHSTIDIDANGLSHCLQGELVHEPDISDSPFAFPARLAAVGLRSLVLAPLRSESRVFGLLVTARRHAHSVSSGECEFLRQLSAHVGLAVQQARLYGALQLAYDELRQTQQAVMQQERLRALGEMASGIAHDINNAISPVLLYVETLIEDEAGLSAKGRGHLRTIARSIDDVAASVARLREFYQQREPQLSLSRLRLNLLADQVAEMTRARWSDMPQRNGIVIRLDRAFEEGLPDIRGIESEVREALTNLVFNAVDAMPEGGVLTLRTCSELTAASAKSPSATLVHLEVVDTGLGMDEDTLRRCREPFFTTKGQRGTGLGLAMVYGFAQRHGADLQIASAPGRGTTVRMSFPVQAESSAALSAPGVAAPGRAPRLRILIVDDDPIVLTSLHDVLVGDGHHVISRGGGREGIDAFRQTHGTPDAFDLVITDLGMPHTDGRQVAGAIKQLSPSTPVIMLTGWGQRLIADSEIPPSVDRVLSKPPRLPELRLVLAQLASARRVDA